MRKVFWIIVVLLLAWVATIIPVKAEPPHPRLAYKWDSMPSGRVILYFIQDGQDVRYLYPLVHEAEPAVPCMPQYNKTTFRLVTWSTTMPYYYTISMTPTARWNPTKKAFVGMD
jgi:hypothetical protein